MLTAVFGLLGVVLGAILSGGVKIWQEIRIRKERIIDFQTALRAEIRSEFARYGKIDWDDHLKYIVSNIKKDNNYTPFVPRGPQTLIFEAIVHEIHILPEIVIEAVVLYYKQLSTISQFIDDLRSDSFARLNAERKIAMYTDYIRMMKLSVEFAQEAHRALEISLVVETVNNPASDPSSPKSA